MRINYKLLLIFSVIWILILLFTLIGVRQVLVKNILDLEYAQITKNIARTHNAIEQELQSLSMFTVDWAHWNDAYNYIEGTNNSFVPNNIDNVALANSNINLMIYYNMRKQILVATYIDIDAKNIKADYPQGLEKYIYPDSIFLKTPALKNTVKGLILTSAGIMLVASAGTSYTDISKPINGILVTGRNLSNTLLDKLSRRIEIKLKLYLPKEIASNKKLKTFFGNTLIDPDNSYINFINNNESYAYTILNDIHHQPIGMVQLELPRLLYAAGHQAVEYFLQIMVIIFILSSVLIWLLLRKIIISRLERLNSEIIKISDDQDYNNQVNMQGGDELSSVCKQINSMLNIIEKAQSNLKKMNFELKTVNTEVLGKSHTLDVQNKKMTILIKALEESESRFRESFDNAAIGISLVSTAGMFIKVNKSLCRLVDYTEEEFLKKYIISIIYENDLTIYHENTKKMLDGTIHTYQIEIRYVKKNGELVWVLLSGSLIRDADTQAPLYFVEQVEDINIRKKVEAELKEMAYHDNLTGLANRKSLQISFDTMSNHAKRYNKKMAVLFIDLDYFKNVNDSYGHEVGDLILKTVSARLQNNVRLTDIIARIGGDEFVMVITEIEAITAITIVIEKLQQVLTEPYIIHDNVINMSATIGVGIFPEDGTDLETLLHCADSALYIAKEKSRGSCEFFKK